MVMPLPREDLEALLELVPWNELASARIVVTGGSGFYGSWLVESALHANARRGLGLRVTALVRDLDVARAKFAHLLHDPALALVASDVRHAVRFDSPTHVIHAAASANAALNAADPGGMTATIVEGTRHVLEASQGVHRFLFTSSGAVYGRLPAEVTHADESWLGPPNPPSPLASYAEAKRRAEVMCVAEAERGRVPAVVSRGFAFVGPRLPLSAHFAIGNFIGDALAGRPIVVKSDGSAIRSYLYAADLTAWNWVMLLRGRPGRAYNVGEEQAISVGDLARLVGRMLDTSVEILGKEDPTRAVDRYVPSTRRAREELGVVMTNDLEGAIRKTVAWHRAQR